MKINMNSWGYARNIQRSVYRGKPINLGAVTCYVAFLKPPLPHMDAHPPGNIFPYSRHCSRQIPNLIGKSAMSPGAGWLDAFVRNCGRQEVRSSKRG
eukprot:1327295-Amorphochlora_amoeboformis.AAC.1